MEEGRLVGRWSERGEVSWLPAQCSHYSTHAIGHKVEQLENGHLKGWERKTSRAGRAEWLPGYMGWAFGRNTGRHQRLAGWNTRNCHFFRSEMSKCWQCQVVQPARCPEQLRSLSHAHIRWQMQSRPESPDCMWEQCGSVFSTHRALRTAAVTKGKSFKEPPLTEAPTLPTMPLLWLVRMRWNSWEMGGEFNSTERERDGLHG